MYCTMLHISMVHVHTASGGGAQNKSIYTFKGTDEGDGDDVNCHSNR